MTASTNTERAERGEKTLRAYNEGYGMPNPSRAELLEDAEYLIADLIVDLRHLADAHNLNWDIVVNSSNHNYGLETTVSL